MTFSQKEKQAHLESILGNKCQAGYHGSQVPERTFTMEPVERTGRWRTWRVLTADGEVKIGMAASWTKPLYYGLRADWKDRALRDFVLSGAWKI